MVCAADFLLPPLLLAGSQRAETNQVFVNLFALSFCQLSMISQEGRKGQREKGKELVPSDPMEDNLLGDVHQISPIFFTKRGTLHKI